MIKLPKEIEKLAEEHVKQYGEYNYCSEFSFKAGASALLPDIRMAMEELEQITIAYDVMEARRLANKALAKLAKYRESKISESSSGGKW